MRQEDGAIRNAGEEAVTNSNGLRLEQFDSTFSLIVKHIQGTKTLQKEKEKKKKRTLSPESKLHCSMCIPLFKAKNCVIHTIYCMKISFTDEHKTIRKCVLAH